MIDMTRGTIRFDDGTPGSVAGVIHGFYLFPMLLGAITAVGTAVAGIIQFGVERSISSLLILFLFLGVGFFYVGRWMRRSLPTKNPRVWIVHALAGSVFLAMYAAELIFMGYVIWTRSSHHALQALAFVTPQLLLFMLPGVRLQSIWMSQEMRAYFGLS